MHKISGEYDKKITYKKTCNLFFWSKLVEAQRLDCETLKYHELNSFQLISHTFSHANHGYVPKWKYFIALWTLIRHERYNFGQPQTRLPDQRQDWMLDVLYSGSDQRHEIFPQG